MDVVVILCRDGQCYKYRYVQRKFNRTFFSSYWLSQDKDQMRSECVISMFSDEGCLHITSVCAWIVRNDSICQISLFTQDLQELSKTTDVHIVTLGESAYKVTIVTDGAHTLQLFIFWSLFHSHGFHVKSLFQANVHSWWTKLLRVE